jgi:hypothetical protein
MCKVVREDTINGDVMRLYKCTAVDMDDFNRKYKMTHMGTIESSVLGAGFADFSTSVANINALTREDMEPLQLNHTFYILKNGETLCYYDAKTTSRGLNNSDSIPLFLRKSQWIFLSALSDNTPYYIARVFLADNNRIRFLRLSLKQ